MLEPCKLQACAIQNCLTKNGYNESKCTEVIDQLYLCCKQYYEENGNQQTTCCPTIKLLDLKLSQRKLGPIDAQLLETKKA